MDRSGQRRDPYSSGSLIRSALRAEGTRPENRDSPEQTAAADGKAAPSPAAEPLAEGRSTRGGSADTCGSPRGEALTGVKAA